MSKSVHTNGEDAPVPHARAERIWIVVADSKIARIFKKNGRLKLFEEMARGAASEKDITNKTVGRSAGPGGGRHKREPHMEQSRGEELAFVGEICDWLDAAEKRDDFDRLVLVAAPRTLGELRDCMSEAIQLRIVAEVDKELTRLDEKDLQEALSEIVWF